MAADENEEGEEEKVEDDVTRTATSVAYQYFANLLNKKATNN